MSKVGRSNLGNQSNSLLSLRTNSKQRKSNQILIKSTTNSKRTYFNFGQNQASSCALNYLCGVIDARNNMVKVFETEVCTDLADQPLAVPHSASESSTTDGDNKYTKSRLLLGEAFGTRKTKQILSSYSKNKIVARDITSKNIIFDKVDDSITQSSQSSADQPLECLPSRNPKAKKIEEIYPIRSLMPSETFDYISSAVSKEIKRQKGSFEGDSLIANLKLSDFVATKLKNIPQTTQGDLLAERLTAIIYLNGLVQVLKFMDRTFKSEALLATFSDSKLGTLIFSEFFNADLEQAKVEKIESLNRHKLLSKLCVLVLTLDGFCTDLSETSTTLKLPVLKVCEYFKLLGCEIQNRSVSVSKGVNTIEASKTRRKIAVLKPLP